MQFAITTTFVLLRLQQLEYSALELIQRATLACITCDCRETEPWTTLTSMNGIEHEPFPDLSLSGRYRESLQEKISYWTEKRSSSSPPCEHSTFPGIYFQLATQGLLHRLSMASVNGSDPSTTKLEQRAVRGYMILLEGCGHLTPHLIISIEEDGTH